MSTSNCDYCKNTTKQTVLKIITKVLKQYTKHNTSLLYNEYCMGYNPYHMGAKDIVKELRKEVRKL